MLQGLCVFSLGGLPVDDPLPALLSENNDKFNLKKQKQTQRQGIKKSNATSTTTGMPNHHINLGKRASNLKATLHFISYYTYSYKTLSIGYKYT